MGTLLLTLNKWEIVSGDLGGHYRRKTLGFSEILHKRKHDSYGILGYWGSGIDRSSGKIMRPENMKLTHHIMVTVAVIMGVLAVFGIIVAFLPQ